MFLGSIGIDHGSNSWTAYRRQVPVLGLAWYCVPELGYCGAIALGIRCCKLTLEGHDPGDEDPLP